MNKLNPFKPNSPVPTTMFAGRATEIFTLEKGLHQTRGANSTNFLITGERGIGKSSLMMLFKHLAQGDIETNDFGKFNFVTLNLVISDRTKLVTLIELIQRNLERELGKTDRVKSFLNETWKFVQRIRIMDSGIQRVEGTSEMDLLMDELASSLAQTCRTVRDAEFDETGKDGIVFLIDEADNACPDLRIGYFFKVLTELLQQHDCNHIMFVVAGLPEIVEKMAASHPSSPRIFSDMRIEELSFKDRKYVIDKGMEEASRQNNEETTITDSAKNQIASLSEGYPHFIQQFAYSAFEFNSDGEISEDDVLLGAFNRGGAIDAIGNRYYASAFHDKIKSDEYRQVLRIMAENLNAWIRKSEIRQKFTGDDNTLSNALQALTARKIILKNPSKMGEYRLQQKGFALWIKLFGDRQKQH